MKRKFSRILGVGLALVLVVALAVPVMANVSQPAVTLPTAKVYVSDTMVDYTISFQINKALTVNSTDYVMVEFPSDTDLDDVAATIAAGENVSVSATAGVGTNPFDTSTLQVHGGGFPDIY